MDTTHISEISYKPITRFCKADDIHYLNETKRYTLLSSDILNHILTDKNLTSQSAQLWQFLYIRASMNTNLEIKLSYKELSNYFGKSVRTMMRYVSALRTNGYIEIKNNYYNNAQTVNTFYVRLPLQLVNHVQNKKNRTVKSDIYNKNSNQKVRISLSDRLTNDEDQKNEIINNESNNSSLETPNTISASIYDMPRLEKNQCLINKENNRTRLDLLYKAIPKQQSDISKWYDNLRKESAIEAMRNLANTQIIAPDKFVTGEGVIDVTQIITKNNYSLYNNNLSNISKNRNFQLSERMLLINNVKKRKVSFIQREKIITTLSRYGFHDEESQKIAKQIIFSVEQEALSDKPLNHAVNIALKLVKSKRWTVPCKMRN